MRKNEPTLRRYTDLSVDERVEVVRRAHAGERVTDLAKVLGIDRQSLYLGIHDLKKKHGLELNGNHKSSKYGIQKEVAARLLKTGAVKLSKTNPKEEKD